MKFFLRFLLLVGFSISVNQQVSASEVSLQVTEGGLSLSIKNVDFPIEKIMQEMKSGLPNRVNLMVSIDNKRGNITRRSQVYEIVYDLWDENFKVASHLSGGTVNEVIKSDKLLIAFLSNYSLPGIIKLPSTNNNSDLTITHRVIFNPIDNERIKKIKDWIQTSQGFEVSEEKQQGNNFAAPVATSRTLASPQGPRGIAQGATSSGPRFKKLFDKILEQNMSADSVAALWKSETTKVMLAVPDKLE